MKESTGELSMVVITLLAIAAIAGIVSFITPLAQEFIKNQWEGLTKPPKTSMVELNDEFC